MVKMQGRIIDFGNGGLDLEATIKENLKDKRIPPVFVAESKSDGLFYFGEVEGNVGADGRIPITRDSKVNSTYFNRGDRAELDKFLLSRDVAFHEVLQLECDGYNIGQGALNASIGRAMFMPGIFRHLNTEDTVERVLVTIYHDKHVEEQLGHYGVTYDPACKDHGRVPTNINGKSLPVIKKWTVRAPNLPYCGQSEHKPNTLEVITSDDAIFIDSVKDHTFLMMAHGYLSQSKPHLYVSPTDSMVNSLGKGAINVLLGNCEVYVAGKDELELLRGVEIKTYTGLKEEMEAIQGMMAVRDGKKARVYVTWDDKGAFVLDEEGGLYHQKAIRDRDPCDLVITGGTTSGCGDAFAAVMTSLEYLRTQGVVDYTTAEILGYAGIGGQINARNRTTCGHMMATVEGINEYLDENSDMRKIRKYCAETNELNSPVDLNNLMEGI